MNSTQQHRQPAKSPIAAFTLIELLVVLAIVAMLTAMAVPEFSRILDRARSAACMGNLRALGVAIGSYVNDNDGRFPFINNPARPVYEEEDLPEGMVALTMLEAFSDYGVTESMLRCPSDVLRNNYFGAEGTSYEWRPIVDNEPKLSPRIYTRRGSIALRNASRVRLVMDTDTTLHFGRPNRLFADGRVVMVQQ